MRDYRPKIARKYFLADFLNDAPAYLVLIAASIATLARASDKTVYTTRGCAWVKTLDGDQCVIIEGSTITLPDYNFLTETATVILVSSPATISPACPTSKILTMTAQNFLELGIK